MSKDIRDSFFDQLYEMASIDKDIIFISADADAFSLRKFKKDLPEQFINVGVAEQNMALVATGLALEGKKVFIYSITSFIAMRCFEQLKVNVCSMNLPISIIGLGSGYSFSYDGPTHHATQDIAIMRTLPEVTILNPCDEETAKNAASHCCSSKYPTYVRIDKGSHDKVYDYQDCKHGIKENSNKAAVKIISTGYMTHKMMKAFKDDIDVDIIDIYRIKPVNIDRIKSLLADSDLVITVEENTPIGGIGSIICEIIADHNIDTKIKRVSLGDVQEFQVGSRDWLIDNSSLNTKKIANLIRSFYNE
jgi:transketolase